MILEFEIKDTIQTVSDITNIYFGEMLEENPQTSFEEILNFNKNEK